ncbi:MAG: EAL domain-containing protein [Cloacibacillus sp.]
MDDLRHADCQPAKKKILIADDSVVDRKILADLLCRDYTVSEADDGAQAIEKLAREPDTALVILDLVMPKLDGCAVLERLQADEKLRDIPVVVITGSDSEESQIKVLDLGAADLVAKPFKLRLIERRIRNIMDRREAAALREKNRLYEQHINQQRTFMKRSETDELTGLYTRAAFLRHTEELLSFDPSHDYVIARWDVDHFKVFNDIYGTKMGDRFLADFGAMLSANHLKGSIIGHWDADHFVACVRAEDFDPDAMSLWLRSNVAKEHIDFEFIFRIGIYAIKDKSVDVSIMCDRAHLALRTTKKSFNCRYAYYEESMRSMLLEEQEMINELTIAFEQRQFVIYLQPQYDYDRDRLIGAEALVRWNHPRKGLIPPMKFIPVLERNGLIIQLDEYVWEEACRLLRKWLDAGIDPPSISVNISRVDVYNPRLCDIITSLAEKYSIEPRYLHLEITESAYMENPDQLINVVEKLRAHSFTVEMDDFGSGYSSLNTLKDVPVDILKLDMKFLSRGNSARGGSILSSVVRMAHWLRLPIIAEGIETHEQADYLKSIGCTCMQGYYFARPMPVAEFEPQIYNPKQSPLSERYKDAKVQRAEEFLDISAQTALLFNSFVGGAAIIEYSHGRVEAMRINDKFLETIGATRTEYLAQQANIIDRFYPESRIHFVHMLKAAAETGEEASCEVHSTPIAGGSDIWTFVRARLLAQSDQNYIYYISIENITKRKKLEAENINLSAQMAGIINNIPGGILTFDEKLRFTYSNENAASMFGFTKSEICGLYAVSPFAAVYPDDKEAVASAIDALFHQKCRTVAVKYRHAIKGGGWIWVQATANLIKSPGRRRMASVVVLDIDEQVRGDELKAAQASMLEKQRALIQTLYDSAPFGVMQYEINEKGFDLVGYNEAAWRIFGYTDEAEYANDLLSGSRVKNTHPEDMPLVQKSIARAASMDETADFDHRIVTRKGEVRWVHTTLKKTRWSETGEILQAVFSDITDQKTGAGL